ncbi:MAG: hypothetical protein PHI52_10195 [Bacteroidales bacterium]|nr:hypothetical protein [Bacteroidales bacterium]
MKNTIVIIFSLIFSIPYLSHAGYKKFQWLTDGSCYAYTLFDANSYIIAATEQGDYSVGGVKNRIVLIKTDLSFNIINSVSFEDTIRGVRDIKIHSICPGGNGFIMCGSIDNNAIIADVDQNFNFLAVYEYSNANVFYSICAYGVCGKDNNSGLMFYLDDQNLGNLDGYQTPTAWEFHKVTYVGSVNELAFAGVDENRNETGFAFFVFDNLNKILIPLCCYGFNNSSNPNSYACITADNHGSTEQCIVSTSYGSQINTFFIDDVLGNPILRGNPKFTHPQNYYFYLQDVVFSQQWNNGIFSWTGYCFDVSSGYTDAFYIRMDFDYNNLPNSPFYNVPFYNYYASPNTDYKLYQVEHYFGDISCVGYYNENNSTGVFTAFPEITSNCDNTTSSLGEDHSIADISLYGINLNSYSIGSDTNYILYSQPRTFNTDTCETIPDENPTNSQKSTTNIKTFDIDDAKIFVSGDELHIVNVKDVADYLILSADGKVLDKGKTGTFPISVSSFTPGFYTLVLKGEKTITSYKFVITHK